MEQKEEIKQEKGLVYESMVLKEIKFSPKFPRVWLVGWFCEKERERGGEGRIRIPNNLLFGLLVIQTENMKKSQ